MASYRKATAAELQQAKLAGAARAAAPHVVTAEYDEPRDRLTLEFDRGFALSISLRNISSFQRATAQDLSSIEILGSGDAVYFDRIDQSLSVATLLLDLVAPLAPAAGRPTRKQSQPPIRVQGGYLPIPSGEPPPPLPKGGSSFRRPKP